MPDFLLGSAASAEVALESRQQEDEHRKLFDAVIDINCRAIRLGWIDESVHKRRIIELNVKLSEANHLNVLDRCNAHV